jgi:hypothetical protein
MVVRLAQRPAVRDGVSLIAILFNAADCSIECPKGRTPKSRTGAAERIFPPAERPTRH